MNDNDILVAILAGNFDEVGNYLKVRNPNYSIDNCPILNWIVLMGDQNLTSLALRLGADPNGCDLNGGTALISAAYNGHVQIVSLLIKAGSNINTMDIDGQTALMAAAKGGHLEVVRLLFDSGANISQADFQKRSALYWALTEADNDKIVSFLLSKGAPKNLISSDGLSPQKYATFLKRSRCIVLLST
jgi:ankyrin repeat protein